MQPLLHKKRYVFFLVIGTVASALSGCGSDDGATVRNLGEADGSSSQSGSSSAPATAGPTGDATADGGYDYASDVSAHRLVVNDICEIALLIGADEIDFESAADIYQNGSNSINSDGSVRTLAGFATATDRNHGLAEYYGTPAPLNDWITEAFDGTGRFDAQTMEARVQGAEKGIQNQTMVAWAIHELESAMSKAIEGDIDPASGAPHNWDEAWAYYHGASPQCGPYVTADKRGNDFGTVNSDGTSAVNEAILGAMIAGRDALADGDIDAAQQAADEIIRNIVITYSQASVKYAGLLGDDIASDDLEAAAKHWAEGLAFFRVVEAIVADAGADVDAINRAYSFDNNTTGTDASTLVAEALKPAWDTLGITTKDIGELG